MRDLSGGQAVEILAKVNNLHSKMFTTELGIFLGFMCKVDYWESLKTEHCLE